MSRGARTRVFAPTWHTGGALDVYATGVTSPRLELVSRGQGVNVPLGEQCTATKGMVVFEN